MKKIPLRVKRVQKNMPRLKCQRVTFYHKNRLITQKKIMKTSCINLFG